MKNNFDLKKFLVENKLTSNSRLLEDFADFGADHGHHDSDHDSHKKIGDDHGHDADHSHDFHPPEDQKNVPAWKAIKAGAQGLKGHFLRFTNFDTEGKQESINWGSHSSDTPDATVGLSVTLDSDQTHISVDYTAGGHGNSKTVDTVAYKAVQDAFKQVGLDQYKVNDSKTGAHFSIPADKADLVIKALKIAGPTANTSKAVADGGNSQGIGDSGPVKAGPAQTGAGSVKVGGKTFKGF